MQELRNIATRKLKGGPEAGKNCGGTGEGDAEEQDRYVDADDGFLRDGVFGQKIEKQGRAAPRDEEADRGASDGDDQGFREELSKDARAASAHSGAYGEFVTALDTAGEQEDGDVAAADEQERCDGAEQEIERFAELFLPRIDHADRLDAKFHREVGGSHPRDLIDERLQFGVGLRWA